MTDYSNPAERVTATATPVTPAEDVRTIALNRVSWGAVLAGVVVALVVQLLLNMLGVGIGVATLDPGTGDNPAVSTFSIVAGIWYLVAGIIAAYAGGYIAGRLSGSSFGSTAALHGLTSWAVATLVVFYLLTTAIGGIIGGVFSGVNGPGRAGRTAATAAQVAAPGLATATDPFGAIERQLREAAGGNDPAALRDAAVAAVRAALTGDQAQAQDARERAAQALARAQNISIEDARNRVAQYEQQYRQSDRTRPSSEQPRLRKRRRRSCRAARCSGSLHSSLARLRLGLVGDPERCIPTITAYGSCRAGSPAAQVSTLDRNRCAITSRSPQAIPQGRSPQQPKGGSDDGLQQHPFGHCRHRMKQAALSRRARSKARAFTIVKANRSARSMT